MPRSSEQPLPAHHDETSATEDVPDGSTARPADPVFEAEQAHLSETYATLASLERALIAKLETIARAAADDKKSMSEELSPDLSSDSDAMETYADFAAVNRVIDAYNLAQDVNAEKLAKVHLLLDQPYFAKIAVQFKPGEEAKELYIGSAGVSDEAYRRLVVDWRSPVAEVYYNQDTGPTSYVANGRTIDVDLKLRRQYDITKDVLNAYFDTNVAIQDSLLLASLSKQRSAQMQAITATIQKEQNLVIRHDDVPVLLVSGIAGSGKTSVLLQRIAYLFYQRRGDLDPSQVFLFTPNEVFRHYIDNVLPDLGERNPESLTWDEFAERLMPPDRSRGEADVSLDVFERIDDRIGSVTLEQDDFRDVRHDGVRLISANQIYQLASKFKTTTVGPRMITLMREELERRLTSRLAQMAGTEEIQDEMLSLGIDEQLAILHETIDPQDEEESRALALRYLNHRFAPALEAVLNDDWLRIDRIGMRMLDVSHLEPVCWLYLKMSITGLGNPDAKYVMIDEVQDYTAAQLAVLARYFRRAHFLLLGDQNQAIKEHTATFEQIRSVFLAAFGEIEECRLMTSYRSSPAITSLFASLLGEEERMRVSSILRADREPVIEAYADDACYEAALREAIAQAKQDDGLTAVIVPWKHQAKRIQAILGEDAPVMIDKDATLPDCGVVLITLELAKGLEFDHVIVPDANAQAFPDDELSRRRLYTTLSRATKTIVVLARGSLTPFLARRAE